MQTKLITTLLGSLVLVGSAVAQEFTEFNYPTRRAIVADVCPAVKISSYKFGNSRANSVDRFSESYTWSNAGSKDVIAVEFDTLKYDPFNSPMIGSRTIFPGHNSATFTPLKPGESDSDGGSSYGSEETYTAVVYVRAVRFADGSVWTVVPADVIKSIKTQVPDILDIGPIVPAPKPKDKPDGG